MAQEAKPITEDMQMQKDRVRSRVDDFKDFCIDSLEDGMGEDLHDDAFLKFAMSAYLDVCAINAEK